MECLPFFLFFSLLLVLSYTIILPESCACCFLHIFSFHLRSFGRPRVVSFFISHRSYILILYKYCTSLDKPAHTPSYKPSQTGKIAGPFIDDTGPPGTLYYIEEYTLYCSPMLACRLQIYAWTNLHFGTLFLLVQYSCVFLYSSL